jgi:thioredoxin
MNISHSSLYLFFTHYYLQIQDSGNKNQKIYDISIITISLCVKMYYIKIVRDEITINNTYYFDYSEGDTIMAQQITKEQFIKDIFDYENNEEWDFQGDVPCVIDFYADWCGPCKMVAPVIEELSEEYDGKVNFFKVDTEKEQELSAAFGIRSIPSLLFIPKEGKPKMSMGALPKDQLKEIVDNELLGAS